MMAPNSPEALRQLAEHGDADAQWNLGVRYHTGDGFVQDDAQAVQWFRLAAEQGHVSAQATLGAYYWAGRGVPQDLTKAYFWSSLAQAQGDDASKSRLEGLSSQMTRAQVASARQDAEEWMRQHHAN
jgi:TPR repeat protein